MWGGARAIELGALAARPPGAAGFTVEDLATLGAAWRQAATANSWEAASLAANEFSDYLAIWSAHAAGEAAPTVAVIRFRASGAYALLTNGRIVAQAPALADLVPALVIAGRVAAQAA